MKSDKSVVVIDTPTQCYDCLLISSDGQYCRKTHKDIDWSSVPDWCPLRPLPEKGTMDNVEPCAYNEGFIDGRNHCIELITGETK